MATQRIRIRLKAYDHALLDDSAKKIVEISGGKISAKSEPGKGTEFMIEL